MRAQPQDEGEGVKTSDLKGAMTDPCPVCMLKPVKGINITGESPEPSEGALTFCFGCGLMQIIRGGLRCALTQEEADHMCGHMEVVEHLLALARMRAVNPFRTQELIREQIGRETGG
jgi:hypothetical protein